MSRLRPRGQNLVLLALTMLFLALMVTMTIGLGFRVRQNHELQNLADATAYSNAVEVARAHNNAALLNRLSISYFVSMAADQSLIDWTSYGWAMTNAARTAVAKMRTSGCSGNRDEGLAAEKAIMSVQKGFFRDRRTLYEQMDGQAGVETLMIQAAIVGLRMEEASGISTPQPDSVQERLYKDIKNQKLARRIIARSGVNDVAVVSSVTDINRREVDCDFGGAHSDLNSASPAYADFCKRATWNYNTLEAAMGTRGNPFLTARGRNPDLVVQQINAVLPKDGSVTVQFNAPGGSAYWSFYKSHGTNATTKQLWADDHGSVTATLRDLNSPGSCDEQATAAATSYVKSTDWVDTSDQHVFRPGTADDYSEKKLHTLGDCTPLCPSVWVRGLGFQPDDDPSDDYGEPKQVAILERDMNRNPYPWELHFKFKFNPTGARQEWDARGQELHTNTGNGLDISRATAMATAISYYHRAEHWDEFPNLLNPFWRATLAPSDVDRGGDPRKGGTDVRQMLGGKNHKWQRNAYDELVRAGYQGLH